MNRFIPLPFVKKCFARTGIFHAWIFFCISCSNLKFSTTTHLRKNFEPLHLFRMGCRLFITSSGKSKGYTSELSSMVISLVVWFSSLLSDSMKSGSVIESSSSYSYSISLIFATIFGRSATVEFLPFIFSQHIHTYRKYNNHTRHTLTNRIYVRYDYTKEQQLLRSLRRPSVHITRNCFGNIYGGWISWDHCMYTQSLYKSCLSILVHTVANVKMNRIKNFISLFI